MTYGLDVVIAIGKRAKGSPKPLKRIVKEVNKEYGLAISLRTGYRYRDLYAALCDGTMHDRAAEIAAALKKQHAIIWLVDATQMAGSALIPKDCYELLK